MTTDTIQVADAGTTIRFSYTDLLRYHGPANPGGVAHAYKVLQRALPLIAPDRPAERREIQIQTAFGGPGARDGFELVTRAVSGDRYRVEPSLTRPDRGPTLERYVFTVRYQANSVTLLLREGYVTDEFIALSRGEDRTNGDEDRLVVLKQEMADRLLAHAADDVYDIGSP